MKHLILSILLGCCMFVNLQATIDTIEVSDFQYTPQFLDIDLGDTVRFIWVSGNHPTISGASGMGDNAFEAISMNSTNPQADLILNSAGSYEYFCVLHYESDSMYGIINVVSDFVVEDCSELFFSEYVEGSGTNKALEIYNPTENPIDLSEYSIKRYNNGNTMASFEGALSETIEGGSVFVIAHSQAEEALTETANLLNDEMVLFNGNDAMALYKGNQLLDVIGQIGENPGEEWSIGSFGTENGTLVRNPDILKGQTDWSEGIEDWSSYPENEFQFLGSHNNNTCTSNSSFQCQELFFSEYIEGSGNHTALEIFNPTNDSIDLEAYTIERYNNGSTSPSYVENLSGSLAPLSTFVLVNPGADVELTGLANLFSEATIYSGNDAISLSKDGSAIDIIGVIGDNPGTFWEVDNGGTLDHTLVRKFEINQGELNWEVGANQWEVFPLDTYNQLGSHSNICGSSNPQFSFLNETIFVEEDEEEYLIGFTFTGLDAQEEEIFLIFTGGTAEIGNDFVFMDTTLVINENTETPFYIPVSLIDDNEEEEMESIIFTIASASGNIDIVTSEFTLNIQDDDTPLPYLQISAVKGIDSLGISTELGTLCELRGVVYGGNLEANGKRQFTIIDPTGGISVYDGGNPNITYEVTEGDSIHIEGDITQFQGLTQIHPSQITLISQDNPVKEPLVVETLGEDTESNLVKLECATLVSPEAWTPGSGTGFSATAYNATDIFIIRIDDQVDLFNTNAPPEWFTIIGISSQFATSSQAPYLDGYQIVPRNFQDVLPCGEVGIETQPIEQLSVKLYPNPSKDWIQIETQNPFGELLVFDLNGRLVLSDRILENNRFTLDIASLNTGLYILHLNGKTGSQTVRFEKN